MLGGTDVKLHGANGYNNGVGTLDAICECLYADRNLINCRVRSLKQWDFKFIYGGNPRVSIDAITKGIPMPASCERIDAKGSMYIESLQPSKQIDTVKIGRRVATTDITNDGKLSSKSYVKLLCNVISGNAWLSSRSSILEGLSSSDDEYGIKTVSSYVDSRLDFGRFPLYSYSSYSGSTYKSVSLKIVAIMEVPKDIYEILDGRIVKK